ncbi:MAG: type II toxin-antitoxin system VapC family toxin [Hyphomonas sp.]
MRITADTNILVRAVLEDDPRQAALAQRILSEAELVAVPVSALCEFVWVLARGYGIAPRDIAGALRGLLASAHVQTDRPAVEAGLALLDAGGDFADGVIAQQGSALGGHMFVSFDKDAIKRLAVLGWDTLLPR